MMFTQNVILILITCKIHTFNVHTNDIIILFVKQERQKWTRTKAIEEEEEMEKEESGQQQQQV